jgi:hypothetical protein
LVLEKTSVDVPHTLGEKFTKIEEELHKNIKRKHSMAGEMLVGESPDDEENGQANESHQLDRLTSEGVDSGNSHPVTWDGASTDKNAVTSGQIIEDLVNIRTRSIANSCEHSRRVKTKTVELKALMLVRGLQLPYRFHLLQRPRETKSRLFLTESCRSSTFHKS